VAVDALTPVTSRLLKVFATAALCVATPAIAAPSGPDPARMAAADRLLDAMHYDSLIERTTSAYIAEAEKTFPAQLEQKIGQPLPAELKDKLFAVIASTIRKGIEDNRAALRRGTAMIYASRFTAAEIEHLIKLQGDPEMIKMQQEMPQIMTESIALGHAAMEREMPGLASSIEQVVKDYYAEQKAGPAT
jgi:hypothetical protein